MPQLTEFTQKLLVEMRADTSQLKRELKSLSGAEKEAAHASIASAEQRNRSLDQQLHRTKQLAIGIIAVVAAYKTWTSVTQSYIKEAEQVTRLTGQQNSIAQQLAKTNALGEKTAKDFRDALVQVAIAIDPIVHGMLRIAGVGAKIAGGGVSALTGAVNTLNPVSGFNVGSGFADAIRAKQAREAAQGAALYTADSFIGRQVSGAQQLGGEIKGIAFGAWGADLLAKGARLGRMTAFEFRRAFEMDLSARGGGGGYTQTAAGLAGVGPSRYGPYGLPSGTDLFAATGASVTGGGAIDRYGGPRYGTPVGDLGGQGIAGFNAAHKRATDMAQAYEALAPAFDLVRQSSSEAFRAIVTGSEGAWKASKRAAGEIMLGWGAQEAGRALMAAAEAVFALAMGDLRGAATYGLAAAKAGAAAVALGVGAHALIGSAGGGGGSAGGAPALNPGGGAYGPGGGPALNIYLGEDFEDVRQRQARINRAIRKAQEQQVIGADKIAVRQ